MGERKMKLNCPFSESGLPKIDVEFIEKLGSDFIRENQPEALKTPCAVDVESLIQNNLNLEICNEMLSQDMSILGLISFKDQYLPIYNDFMEQASRYFLVGNIILDPRLREVPTRYRFTLMHEGSHWILHRTYYENPSKRDYIFRHTGFSYVACKKDPKEYSRKNPKEAETDDEWVEWQADNLTGAILMPRETFIPAAQDIMHKLGYEDLHIVAGRPDPKRYEVLDYLADLFQVSRRSAKIRMRILGLYVEPTEQC
jgi:Zn-dependent peptidase ImmA (M78 family)